MNSRALIGSLAMVGCMVWRAGAQTNVSGSGVSNRTAKAQSILVTNWMEPTADFRVVRGQLYNAVLSQRWQWLTLSNAIREAGVDGVGHAITNLSDARSMTILTGITNADKGEFQITIFHYPFEPTNFQADAKGNVVPLAPLKLRLFPIFAETNEVAAGEKETGSLLFDWGEPSTNKIPVVQRVKVKR